jgi:NitT/TauT family transport system substrate-binding protein
VVKKIILLLVTLAVLCSGCAAKTAAAGVPAQSAGKLSIYAPASTSSIPVILAASKMENVELTLYTNQAQANTLFLRGDVNIMVTGISVGVDMFRNGAPVQVVNSYVSGLSYLMTNGKKIDSIAELKGQQIYIPFKGSPIEEVTAALAQNAGLKWPDDFKPVYMPFDSSVELLKQGKAGAVVLPEPYVSLLENQPNVFVSLSYYDEWQKIHPTDAGYPQVGALVKADWAQSHGEEIAKFNQALIDATNAVEKDPAAAVEAVKAHYKFPAAVLAKSLKRTSYHLVSGAEMQKAISSYYTVIGKPLDENYAKYYYIPAK